MEWKWKTTTTTTTITTMACKWKCNSPWNSQGVEPLRPHMHKGDQAKRIKGMEGPTTTPTRMDKDGMDWKPKGNTE